MCASRGFMFAGRCEPPACFGYQCYRREGVRTAMGDEPASASPLLRKTLYVAVVALGVAALGSVLGRRLSFGVSVLASGAIAFGTVAVAASKGRAAIVSGGALKAGAAAAGLLAVRLAGLAGLMVLANFVPALFDPWGVAVGLVVVDGTFLFLEGSDTRSLL